MGYRKGKPPIKMRSQQCVYVTEPPANFIKPAKRYESRKGAVFALTSQNPLSIIKYLHVNENISSWNVVFFLCGEVVPPTRNKISGSRRIVYWIN